MVNFARLEWSLAGGISRLIGPELAAGQMVALEVPFVRKCALFSGLCQRKLAHAPRKVEAELKVLTSQLLQCESSRNQATHPLWLRPSPNQGGERTKTARLKAVADELAKTADAIDVFMGRHVGNRNHQEHGRRRPTRG
jgi:hypothetical protein